MAKRKRMTEKEMKQFLEEIEKYGVSYVELESRIQKQNQLDRALSEILTNTKEKKPLMMN